MSPRPPSLASVKRFSISTAGRGVVPGPARVLSVHAKAAYVRAMATGDLFALTSPKAPAGPIHASTVLQPLSVGDLVDVDLTGAARWEGDLPARLDTGLLLQVLPAPPEPLPDVDLAALTAALGGRGPGLTPAGDDCLAGLYLIATATGDDVTALAASVPTNDIAKAFLHWAARGQSIEPVHRLLTARDQATAERALHDLLRFGHSSGADLARGLRAAVQRLCNGACTH